MSLLLAAFQGYSQEKPDSMPTLKPQSSDTTTVLKPETNSKMPRIKPDSIQSEDSEDLQKEKAADKDASAVKPKNDQWNRRTKDYDFEY